MPDAFILSAARTPIGKYLGALTDVSAPQLGAFAVAEAATHLGVHLLARDDLELARWFGGQTGDEVDKFADCSWHVGPAGIPILDAAPAWFVGAILDRFDLGDHVGYLLNPVDGHAPDETRPWVSLTDVSDLKPGHEA